MGIAIVLVGLLLTKVRGEYIALLISAVMVVSVSYFRGWLSSTQTFKVAAGGFAVLILGAPFIVQRFLTGAWGEDRLPLMRTAINMFKENWLLGVGVNILLYIDRTADQLETRGNASQRISYVGR
jgi:ABC-type arginine/histidine transport system permease subunit